MRARASLLLLPILLTATVPGCLTTGSEEFRLWQDEADAHRPFGLAATFDLRDGPYRAEVDEAEATFEAVAGLQIAPLFPSDRPFVYFHDATVAGLGTGTLIVEGAALRVGHGTLSTTGVDAIIRDEDGTLRAQPVTETYGWQFEDRTFPEAWEPANRSAFFADRVEATVESLALEDLVAALMVTADGFVEADGPLVVDAAGFSWDAESTVVASAFTASAARFSLAGAFTNGTLSPDGHDPVAAPDAVVGRDASLAFTPDGARTTGTARVTQWVADEAFGLQAEVEVAPPSGPLVVEAGTEDFIDLVYREKSYVADAVLGDITVRGEAAPFLSVPVDDPPSIVAELWDVVTETGWAAPFFALPLAVATPWIAFAELFSCIFADCPTAYPTWMDAGAVGTLSVVADATDVAPGTYTAEVVFEGRNHEELVVPLTVEVTPRQEQAR